MTQNRTLKTELEDALKYGYVVECKDRTVHLTVEARDVFRNADDEIDCPLDVVLRKNDFSLQDLMSWNARIVRFVRFDEEGTEITLNSVSLNVNL
ncbi:hypothetical protein VXN63_04600 [Marinilactibacillus sp. XAAS-LB27]|uniref:hypothetical protein n=1 Tax=Marinilactibacillus sp. XAAS-LB27 TaxID=3114538 RepID=UPI002E1946A1|nr:hypothetical protein [Marinilactibacillus sp. XAAS-LB27]